MKMATNNNKANTLSLSLTTNKITYCPRQTAQIAEVIAQESVLEPCVDINKKYYKTTTPSSLSLPNY